MSVMSDRRRATSSCAPPALRTAHPEGDERARGPPLRILVYTDCLNVSDSFGLFINL